MTICSVDGCGKRSKRGSQHCSMHAERLRKHGDVHANPAKVRGTCTLDGCARPHFGRGYCVKHYKRWAKYGDPLGGSTDWGAVQRWVREVAVPYEGAECLQFPFSRNANGYGKLRHIEGNIGAHVLVLTLTAGEKPTPKHEACHRCGNGHEGCVNPRHLYWGTRADNVQDAMAHGTAYSFQKRVGAAAPAAKYDDAAIERVRHLLSEGLTQMEIARRTGVSQGHVSRIKLGQTRTA